MGYYTIEISPESKDIKAIVTEFGKFIKNRILIGICTYVDTY